MITGLPDSYFVHDGVGLGMVRAGEPRLRPDRRGSDRTGMLRAGLARVADVFRMPEVLRVSTSR